MLVWSIVLPVFTFLLAFLILFLFRDSGSLTLATGSNVLSTLAGILLVTVIMLIVHEGLHGLVFWLITHEVRVLSSSGTMLPPAPVTVPAPYPFPDRHSSATGGDHSAGINPPAGVNPYVRFRSCCS